MGFDLYGKNPKSEKGKYFRNNVWWWHPLWEYCLDNYSSICSKVKYGHSNDGDGLDEDDSFQLALLLKADISNGKVKAFAEKRKKQLADLPKVACTHCESTGIRNDAHVQGTCNACQGKGIVDSWDCNYPFSLENVEGFYEFSLSSGGFSIC